MEEAAAAEAEGELDGAPGLPERALRRLRCPVCAAQGTLCCSQCRSAFYCSAEHVKSDWSEHKKACKRIKKMREARLAPHECCQALEEGAADPAQPQVAKGSRVALHFSAAHVNRRKFDDSCAEAGATPVEVVAGAGCLLPALDRALIGMRKGQTSTFVLLSEGAYAAAQLEWRDAAPIDLGVHSLITITVVDVR